MLVKGVTIMLCVCTQQKVRDWHRGTTTLGTLQMTNDNIKHFIDTLQTTAGCAL